MCKILVSASFCQLIDISYIKMWLTRMF